MNTLLYGARAFARVLFSRMGVALVAYVSFGYILWTIYNGLIS